MRLFSRAAFRDGSSPGPPPALGGDADGRPIVGAGSAGADLTPETPPPSLSPSPSTGPIGGSRPFAGLAERLVERLVDTVLPPVCAACQEPIGSRDALCPACWAEVDFLTPPLCHRLGIRLPYSTGGVMISAAAAARPPVFDRARAVAHYDAALRRLVHRFKFQDHYELRRLFAIWLEHAGQELLADADLIVPVPLTRGRLLWRRFNQAAVLANELSQRTGVPAEALALRRIKPTRSQVGLSLSERRLNVRGAFAVSAQRRRRIEGRRVLLIDDVITTGATADACARALYKAGAAGVDVLAVGRVDSPLRVGT